MKPDPEKRLSLRKGLTVKTRNAAGEKRTRINWNRAAILAAALAALGWAGKTAGYYHHFKYGRGYEETSWGSMFLYPLNRQALTARIAGYYMRQADKAIAEGYGNEAFQFLKKALDTDPGNLDARVNLARVLFTTRPDTAADYLIEGLDYAGRDAEYLQTCCQLLLEMGQREKLLKLSRELLRKAFRPNPYNQTIALAAAQAYFDHGNISQTAELISFFQLEEKKEGVMLAAKLSVRRGMLRQAVKKLEAFTGAHPGEAASLHGQLAKHCLEADAYEKAFQYARMHLDGNPHDKEARLLLFTAAARSGKDKEAGEQAVWLLENCRDDEDTMLEFMRALAGTGNAARAWQAHRAARAAGFDSGVFSMLLLEAFIHAASYAEAEALCAKLQEEDPYWLDEQKLRYNSLRTVLYTCLDKKDLADFYLERVLEDAKTGSDSILYLADTLHRTGKTRQAIAVLRRGMAMQPRYPRLLGRIVEIEIEAGRDEDAQTSLRHLLRLPRAIPSAILRRIRQRLRNRPEDLPASWTPLLAELNEALGKE